VLRNRGRRGLKVWFRRISAEYLVLAIGLALLAGCAAATKPAPAPVVQAPGLPEGPSVGHLGDGREGFMIREMPNLETSARQEFEAAVALLKEGRYEPASQLLEKVVEGSPGVTAPYIDLAMAYRKLDKPELAEEQLKKALSLVPDHPVASNEYALLLRQRGRFSEARTVYEKTLASFPEYLPAHRNLGILCDLYLNDRACALEQYQIYSEAMPEDRQVRMWIADLQLR